MPDNPGSSDFNPSTRGDSAWQEARDAIASRNANTRRVGKAERETSERERDARKQAAAAQRRAQAHNRRTP